MCAGREETVSRGERAARTREAILDAAAEVFDRNGYPGAGLAEILDTAGVTKGALYFHFASKEELARAIIDEQFGLDRPMAPMAEGLALQQLIDLTFDIGRHLAESVRVRAAVRLAIEHASFSAPLVDPYVAWIRVARTLLERAAAAGELRPDADPDTVAHLLVGAFAGVQLTSEVLTSRKDLPRRLAELWRLVLPALVTPEQQAGLLVPAAG
jgi:AcrR family transcriptional regulator